MARIRVGTCGWTDPTLINSGWYPSEKMTAEERLRFYAGRFGTVEVDSTFYALPSEKVIGLQAARTPADFTLHYKAFGLLTKHTVDGRRLPTAIKNLLGEKAAGRARLGPDELPVEARELAWRMFVSALRPVAEAGKLGVVLFQFPPYYTFSPENLDYILECRSRLKGQRLAVEFRHGSWLDPTNRRRTLRFLENHDLTYVCVDEPQFPGGLTVPPLVTATADLSYVRMHGRNREAWFKKEITVAERFAYQYSDEELAEWADKLARISPFTSEIYVLFNNCFRDYAVRDAARLAALLDG